MGRRKRRIVLGVVAIVGEVEEVQPQVLEGDRDSAGEFVPGEVEVVEDRELSDLHGDSSSESVV